MAALLIVLMRKFLSREGFLLSIYWCYIKIQKWLWRLVYLTQVN